MCGPGGFCIAFEKAWKCDKTDAHGDDFSDDTAKGKVFDKRIYDVHDG